MRTSLSLHLPWVLLALTLLTGFPGKAPAESDKTISPQQQLEFAEQYFEAGDYFRAATEWERFLFFFPDDPRTDAIRYRIGQACFQNREYEKALDIFKALVDKNPESDLAFSASFDLSDCYRMMKDDYNAVAVLEQAARRTGDPGKRYQAYYRAGWVFLETGQWEKARWSFQQIRKDPQDRYRVKDLQAALVEATKIPQKSPTLAGTLSLMPGGGYLYCNRPKDALMSFLLNGGLIWAAVEAFHNKSPALGAVISFVEAGFYAGNIYGGISSAHKYNERQKKKFIEDLKKNTRISLNGNRETPGLAILFQKSF
jgi:TolA-binding protein